MLDWLFSQTPLRFFVEGIWRDEAFSYLLAKRSVPEIITITSQDFNPPLYYIVLHYWIQIFGSSEVAMRSLSLLFYALGAFVVFEFIRVVFKKSFKESFLYFGVFLLNPLVLYYAFEARMYSMFFFFATASFYLFYQKKYRLYAVFTLLGLYTHYFMALAVAAQMVYVALTSIREKQIMKYWVDNLKYPVLTILLFLPWLVYFLSRNGSVSNEFWISELPEEHVKFMPAYVYSGLLRDFWYVFRENMFTREVFRMFNIFLYFVAALGFLHFRKNKEQFKLFLLFFCWVAVPLLLVWAVTYFMPIFLPRYIIFISAGISLLVIYVTSHLHKSIGIPLLLVFVACSWHFQVEQLEHRERGTMRTIVPTISTVAKENDLIYVTSELDIHTAQYYFGEQKVYIYDIPYEDIPSYVGKVLIPADRVTFQLPIYPQKAIIVNDKGEYEVRTSSY